MNQIAHTGEFNQLPQITVLSDEEVDLVSGGHPVLLAIAGAAAAMSALKTAEELGEKAGRAIYRMTH